MDTWANNRGETTVLAVFDQIAVWFPRADGITISGGEPFDQVAALRELLLRIRSKFSGDILAYSGFSLADLHTKMRDLNKLIDCVITEPFEIEMPQTKALRGSDNQELNLLTKLGRDRFLKYERNTRKSDLKIDLFFDDLKSQVWMAGIPKRGDLQKLSEILRSDGHTTVLSEDLSAGKKAH